MPHRTPQPSRARRTHLWFQVGTSVACALVVTSAVYLASVDREHDLGQAEAQADIMANYLSQHARDTFEITELALTSVGRLIGSGALTESEIERVRLDMKELLRRVPRLSQLSYYEQSGWLITSSEETANSVSQNISRTSIFERHQTTKDDGLEISKPYQQTESGPWLIDLSQAVYGPDRQFGGVLVATMRVQYFADFYDSFDQGNNARVNLLGQDGHLIARNPYNEKLVGLDLSKSDVFQQVQVGRFSGHSRVISPVDGIQRLASFHRVVGEPLTVVYSVTEDAALAEWNKGLPSRAMVASAVIIALLFGASRLSGYIDRRVSAEAALLEMSQTDALTGLLNRRSFDHTIAREWLRCVSSARPLSLLMIDVDHFKSFNDTYGHQAGDACLRAAAKALQMSLYRQDDRVMRYGGEEFAVILPDTGPDQAKIVAERLRQAIENLSIAHGTSTKGHVTISIGYATEDRQDRMRGSEAQLIADADRALYAAKADGRNRAGCGDALTLKKESSLKPRLIHTNDISTEYV